MIRRQLRIYVSILAVFLLCGLIAQAAAGDNNQLLPTKNVNNRIGAKSSGQFSVSGTFSGELNGYITVGGKKVFISKATALQRVGAGKIKRGTHVSNVFIYAAGSVKRGIPTAALVLVRSNSGLGEQAVIPSKNKPKFGVLKENTPQ